MNALRRTIIVRNQVFLTKKSMFIIENGIPDLKDKTVECLIYYCVGTDF